MRWEYVKADASLIDSYIVKLLDSYLRLIDYCITLRSRVMKMKKKLMEFGIVQEMRWEYVKAGAGAGCGGTSAPAQQVSQPHLLHPPRETSGHHTAPCTLYPTPYALHPTPYTLLHPIPCTLHPAPCTLDPRT